MNGPVCLQPESPPDPADTEAGTDAKWRPRRILVVDDSADLAHSCKILLETMGHEVWALTTGREVMASIAEFRPEIVFMDIGMPDMDGNQVAAAIRAAALEPRPLLVAVTGYGQNSDRKAAMEAGFDRYQLKPLAVKQIEILLSELDTR